MMQVLRIAAYLLAAGFWIPLSACTEPTVAVDAGATVAEVRDFQTIKDDARIRLQVDGDFLDDQAGLFKNVNVDVYEANVMLTGVVKTGADKLRAVQIVENVEGVREVLDEIQVTSNGDFQQAAEDVAIETTIKIRLLDEESVNSVNMRWRSVNGTVYLFGRALSDEEQRDAMEVIKEVKGVRRVINRQYVRPPPR